MFGPEFDPLGKGLGLSGAHAGGGGRARSIGLGAGGIFGHGSAFANDQGSGVTDASVFQRDASLGVHEPRVPSLSTQVAPEVVERVLRQASGRLQACHGRGDEQRFADVQFEVTVAGAAAHIVIAESSSSTASCLVRTLSELRFLPAGNAPSRQRYRVDLR